MPEEVSDREPAPLEADGLGRGVAAPDPPAPAPIALDEDRDRPTPQPVDHPWKALLRMGRPRATRANVLATVMALLLGFAIATQVRQNQNRDLETLRSDELVRILDSVQADNARLGTETQELESARDKLLSGQADSEEARKAAQERLDTLGILAGTVPAKGSGVVLSISDPKRQVTAPTLLDTIEELRDAGAEAMQINAVRIVASTWFADESDGTVSVAGTRLEQPYRITVIGDPQTLATAMEIPGGVRETVQREEAKLEITREESVTVDALHTLSEHRYARPVTPTDGSTP